MHAIDMEISSEAAAARKYNNNKHPTNRGSLLNTIELQQQRHVLVLLIVIFVVIMGVSTIGAYYVQAHVQAIVKDTKRAVEQLRSDILRVEKIAVGAETNAGLVRDATERDVKELSGMIDKITQKNDKAETLKGMASAAAASSVVVKNVTENIAVVRSALRTLRNQLNRHDTRLDALDGLLLKDRLSQIDASLAEIKQVSGTPYAAQQAQQQQRQRAQDEERERRRELEAQRIEEAIQKQAQLQAQAQAKAQQQQYVFSVGQHRDPNVPDIPDVIDTNVFRTPEAVNNRRREMVKTETLHAWNAYKRYAWGHDELRPISKSYKNWGSRNGPGLGLTIVDSLSTLLIMNLTAEFERGVRQLVEFTNLDQSCGISVFETTIRMVGGLLSAFELDGERNRKLVELAERIANKVLVAYNTTTGIPHQTCNLRTGEHWSPEWTGGAAVLSEAGSAQLEFRTLSYHTGNPVYDMKTTHVFSILRAKCPKDTGLCPTFIDIDTAMFHDDHVTVGALGDSFYEYLLKQYLLTGNTEQTYRSLATTAFDGIITHLLRYSEPSRQAYLAEFMDNALDHKMDELSCFFGGVMALASTELPDSGMVKTYRRVAEQLVDTCFQLYKNQNLGIAPEIVEFHGGQDFTNGADYYLLRPETTEAIFYMWRLTGDEKYRDMQWEIFRHVAHYCRVESGGYAGIKSILLYPRPELDDVQQSFFFAEFLKYVYLTFSPSDLVALRDWVFNTEGHPLKRRKRDPLDVWRAWEKRNGDSMPWYPPTVDGVTEVETARMRDKRLADGNRRRVAPIDRKSIIEPPGEIEDDDAGGQAQAPAAPVVEQRHDPAKSPLERAGVERVTKRKQSRGLRRSSASVAEREA